MANQHLARPFNLTLGILVQVDKKAGYFFMLKANPTEVNGKERGQKEVGKA